MSIEQNDEVLRFLGKLVAAIESSRYGESGHYLEFLYQAISTRKKEIEGDVK
jgi:hypothetical protein